MKVIALAIIIISLAIVGWLLPPRPGYEPPVSPPATVQAAEVHQVYLPVIRQ